MTKNEGFSISREVMKVQFKNGYYLFKLGKVLSDKNISLNKFSNDTNTDFKTIKKHCNGDIILMDLALIDRWCDYLEVNSNDIYEYVSEK